MRKNNLGILERTAIAVASFASLAGGCASPDTKYEPVRMSDIPVEMCVYRTNFDNVKIGATFLNQGYEAEIFNRPNDYQKNLAREGTKPLYLRFENPEDEELFLNTSATEFFDEFGRKWVYSSPKEASRRRESSRRTFIETVGFIISPIGAAIAIVELEKTDRQREADYTEKSFEQRHRISYDERGFVFLTEKSKDSGDFEVSRERKIRLYIECDGLPQEVILTEQPFSNN